MSQLSQQELEKKVQHYGRAYQCLHCLKIGQVKADPKQRLLDHVLRIHYPLDRAAFYCTLCQFRCEDKETLTNHVRKFTRHVEMVKRRNLTESSTFLRSGTDPVTLAEEVDYTIMSRPASTAFFVGRLTSNHKDILADALDAILQEDCQSGITSVFNSPVSQSPAQPSVPAVTSQLPYPFPVMPPAANPFITWETSPPSKSQPGALPAPLDLAFHRVRPSTPVSLTVPPPVMQPWTSPLPAFTAPANLVAPAISTPGRTVLPQMDPPPKPDAPVVNMTLLNTPIWSPAKETEPENILPQLLEDTCANNFSPPPSRCPSPQNNISTEMLTLLKTQSGIIESQARAIRCLEKTVKQQGETQKQTAELLQNLVNLTSNQVQATQGEKRGSTSPDQKHTGSKSIRRDPDHRENYRPGPRRDNRRDTNVRSVLGKCYTNSKVEYRR